MCKTETSHICSHAVVFVGLLSYLMFGGKTRSSIIFLLGKWCQNDVVKKSMRRHHVASTFIRRHFTSCARWVTIVSLSTFIGQIKLTQCISVDSSSIIYWASPFVILGVSGLFCCVYSIFDGKCC